MPLKFFATLISLAKTIFFSLWILYLFILYISPLPYNIYLIEELLRNLALKHYSAEPVLTLIYFSFGDNYYKKTNGVAMGTKMGPSYANLFVGFIVHQFFSQINGPKPGLYGRLIDDCIGAIFSAREELIQIITVANHPALKYTWEISDICLTFLDIKVSTEGNGQYYKPTDSTDLHRHLLYLSSHLSYIKNSVPFLAFLDFVVYVATALIFPTIQRQCTSFSINVAILFLLLKWATNAPNKLIDSQHYKRHRRKMPTALDSPSRLHGEICHSKNRFKLLQHDSETGLIFSQLLLISFKREKDKFLVRSSLQTNDEPITFKCGRARYKTCPFIHYVEKTSRPGVPFRLLITSRAPLPMSSIA